MLADPTRRRILDLLAERGPLTVNQLAAEFPDLVVSGISKHLMVLRGAGLVSATPQGRQRLYRIDAQGLAVDTVLENRVLFGSVNARRDDWVTGVEALDRVKREFPGALEELIGLRVPLDRFEEAFAFHGGKATLVIDDSE